MASNYSIYSIPAFYILSLLPHQYALYTISRSLNGGFKGYDNRTPRAAESQEKLKQKVPKEVFARYERAEATHKNGMENLALFVGAVILGNLAHLPASTLNTVTGAYLATRMVYTLIYLNCTTHAVSFVRTGVWGLGAGLCMYLIVKAGNVLVDAY